MRNSLVPMSHMLFHMQSYSAPVSNYDFVLVSGMRLQIRRSYVPVSMVILQVRNSSVPVSIMLYKVRNYSITISVVVGSCINFLFQCLLCSLKI